MPQKRSEATHYFSNREIHHLFAYLNGYTDTSCLRDKAEFYRICRHRKLPTIPVIAEVRQRAWQWMEDGTTQLPQQALIVKPTFGANGRGLQRWTYDPAGYFYNRAGKAVLADQLPSLLIQRSGLADPFREGGLLIQPRLQNHRQIAELSNGGLSTVRIVTAHVPPHPIESVISVFKMPTGNGIADNLVEGGIASPVEGYTGELGPAVSKKLLGPPILAHPDTGRPIAGKVLPQWPQVVALACRAHAAFPQFVFLAWDIAITDAGPVLVEGNSGWCVELVQRPHQHPLGKTRFAEFCVLWLERQRSSPVADRL